MLALKKIFGISKDNDKLASNIWQLSEKRERKQKTRREGVTSTLYKSANLDSATINIANFSKLEILHGKPNERVIAAPLALRGSEKQQRTSICETATYVKIKSSSDLSTPSTASVAFTGDCTLPIPPRRRAKLRPPPAELSEGGTLSRAKLGPPPPLLLLNTASKRESSRGTICRARLPPPPLPPTTNVVPRQQAFSLEKNITAKLQAEIAEKIRQLEEAKQIITKLKFDVDEKTQQSSEAQRIIAESNAKIAEKTQLLTVAQRIIAELKAEDTKKTSLLAEVRQNVEKLTNGIVGKTRQLLEAQRICERLTTEIDEKDRQIHEAPRIIAELRVEIAEKTKKIIEAERTIDTHGAFCSICLTEVANRMWSGCNHLAACRECAESYSDSVTEENRRRNGIPCPKCRTHGYPLPAFI